MDDSQGRVKAAVSKPCLRKITGIVILATAIILIWLTMSLPTLFYFMRQTQNSTGEPMICLPFDKPLLNQSTSILINVSMTAITQVGDGQSQQVKCSDDFFTDNNVTCEPECSSFSSLSKAATTAIQVTGIIVTAISLLFSAAVLVLVGIKHKKMLKFPQTILVYMTITVSIQQVFLLVGYSGRGSGQVCTSRNYLSALCNPSPLCIAIGAANVYTTAQLGIFWIFQVVIAFWRFVSPFHAKYWERRGKMKHIHILVLIAGLIVPCAPVIAAFPTGGFIYIDYLPNCIPQDIAATYYSTILPGSLILAFGITLMLVYSWSLITGHSKLRQGSVLEIKLGIPLFYYAIYSIFFFITFSLVFAKNDQYLSELLFYFNCESIPGGAEVECERSAFEHFAFPILTNIVLFLSVLIPIPNLVYIVRWSDIKLLVKKVNVLQHSNADSQFHS